MPKKPPLKKITKTRTSTRKKKKQQSFFQKISLKDKKTVLVTLIVFALIGAIFVFSSSATAPTKFMRKVDVGPQASTYGHTPAGTLKKWNGNTLNDTTIKAANINRDSDGWFVIKGYDFTGPIYIETDKVALEDCRVTMSPDEKGALNARTGKYQAARGTINATNAKAQNYRIEHCHIDQSMTGYSLGGVVAYYKGDIRYSLIEGSGDGIKIGSRSVVEHNYINITGQCNVASPCPGHIDGIHGEYFKFDWIARHNTIIAGVVPESSALAAGAENSVEKGGNIGIWAPDTPEIPDNPTTEKNEFKSYSGAEGVVAEDNYINGFNTGIGVMGTNPDNPAEVRNNSFGKNFRYYPGNRIRTYDRGRTGGAPGPTNYVIVEANNIYDLKFNESTGLVAPYDGGGTTTSPEVTPTPNTEPEPTPDPEPTPAPTPTPVDADTGLPLSYGFDANIAPWEGQGNTTVQRSTTEGASNPGSLQINVDANGLYQDTRDRSARVGTTQYSDGITVSPGQKISASVAIKAASTQRDARCELRFYDGNKIITTVEGTLSKVTSNWSNLSCSATAPSGSSTMALRVYVKDTTYGEKFFVDDITVQEGDIIAAPAPAPSPPEPTPDPTPTPNQPAPEPADTTKPSVVKNVKASFVFDWTKFKPVMKLNWDAATDNNAVAQYTVTRAGKLYSTVVGTNFNDSSVVAGTSYSYRVSAQDAAGNTSALSEAINAKGACFLFWCWLE